MKARAHDLLLTCVLLPAAWMTPTSAFAEPNDRAACLDAVAKGQTLRDEHKLIEARESFRVCARSQCPAVVQGDCASFLDAVERNLPSVVFTAKDGGGADLTDVQVSADGQPLVTKLDGAALPMNPGTHTFLFARGGVTAKTSATILEGAKNQIVSVTLAAPPPAPVAIAPPVSRTPRAPSEPASPPAMSTASDGSKRGSWLPIAAIAVGGVGLATGVVFTVLAHGKRSDGDSLCPGGRCPDPTAAQVASLNSDATTFGQVSTAAYAVGGVALAAGVVLLLVQDRHPPRTGAARFVISPTVGLGTAGIAGVF